MRVQLGHGAARWVDADVGGRGDRLAIDDDIQVGMEVVGDLLHRGDPQPGLLGERDRIGRHRPWRQVPAPVGDHVGQRRRWRFVAAFLHDSPGCAGGYQRDRDGGRRVDDPALLPLTTFLFASHLSDTFLHRALLLGAAWPLGLGRQLSLLGVSRSGHGLAYTTKVIRWDTCRLLNRLGWLGEGWQGTARVEQNEVDPNG